MLQKQVLNYRNLVVLKDGTQVLLRALTPDDRDGLLALFSTASEGDVRYLRHNVKDTALITSWCEDLNYTEVLPIVAILQDRIVGLASLHFRVGPERHVGEVRIFLAKDFRRRGLGTRMLQTMIEIARKHGLHWLEANVIASQNKVVKAFQGLGFEYSCTSEDYFMFPDGETQDVVRLLMRLQPKSDEF